MCSVVNVYVAEFVKMAEFAAAFLSHITLTLLWLFVIILTTVLRYFSVAYAAWELCKVRFSLD